MKQEYEYSTETSRFSNIGQQFEKAVWFKRNLKKYQEERIMLFLGSRFTFLSIYINNQQVVKCASVSTDDIAKLMSNQNTIADAFDYCRQHFCRELTPVKQAEVTNMIDQLDMFGALG